jgi:hypothetical protein
VRKIIWVGVVALALALSIFGWILGNAGLFGFTSHEKQGPETTFAPQGGSPTETGRAQLRQ